MKLTLRGRVLVAIIIVVTLSGFAYGARGLNAVAVPGIVVLGFSAFQIYDLTRPKIDRDFLERAQRGETIRVRILLESASSLPAHVHEGVGPGLAAEGNEWHITLDREELEYDLLLRRRGTRSVGPLTIDVRDIFGLVSRTYQYRSGDSFFGSRSSRRHIRRSLLVRPRIYPLAGPAQAAILGLYGSIGDARDEFDYLRSYRRGDPLKDIHWKSSAKYPDEDFVVKEFTADQDTDTVVIAAESAKSTVDTMADATASITAGLLRTEVDFVLYTPVRQIDAEEDDAYDQIMDHLAEMKSGSFDEGVRQEADLVIRGDGQTVWVTLGGRRYEFRDLIGGTEVPLPPSSPSESETTAIEETAT